jgi:integrase
MKLKELATLHIRENILSEATIIKYNSVVSIFIKDTGVHLVSSLDHETILNWRDDILSRSSAGNWNNYRRHLRALLQTAIEFKVIKENPFTKVKSVAHYPNKKYLLSEQEIQDLLTFCNNIEHGWFWSCVITTLRYTGIRLRQLVGLAWSDFDLENRHLILRTSSSKTKREYTVPINQQVIDSILLVRQKATRIDTDQNKNNQIFNITLINSRYFADNMNEEHVARFFVKASKTLNSRVSAHRFRHAFATKLANNTKTNIKTVQNLLGHSSVYTTLGYVHPDIEDMRKAINLL